MAVDLAQVLDPAHSALLVMECQEGIIGKSANLGALAEAVNRHGIVGKIAQLIAVARQAAVPIFYLTASRRTDQGGSTANCLLLALGRKSPPLVLGSPQQAVVAELSPQPNDYVLARHHGLTPFHATELDQILRNLGVRTVVATGVSVNIGITGLTLEAVNAGYQVVLPRDAVTGTPDTYVDAVFENTLRLLATVSDSNAVRTAWQSAAEKK